MSNLSQFFSSGGGGSQVGDSAYLLDGATLITKPNNEQWLRSGSLATAASYPIAAAVKSAQCFGTPVTLPASITATQWAHNGSGTVVVAYGDATNVMVSTDYGATWNLRAHGLAAQASAVVWNGTNFNVFANNATAVSCAYSVVGTTWTAGGTSASLSTGTVGTCRAANDGTTTVVVTQHAGVSVVTTTTGVTLTSRTIPTAFGSYQPIVTVMSSLGASRWFITYLDSAGNTQSAQSTSSDGSAWAARTTPAFANGKGSLTNNGTILVLGGVDSTALGGSGFYTSTTGANGSWTAVIPGANFIANAAVGLSEGYSASPLQLYYDGTRFVAGSSTTAATGQYLFGTSTDLVSWDVYQVSVPAAVLTRWITPIPLGTKAAFLESASAKALYAANFLNGSCDYVGVPQNSSYVQAVNGRKVSLYMRIK